MSEPADEYRLNPRLRRNRRRTVDPVALAREIRAGDRIALARGITLIESEKPADWELGGQLLQAALTPELPRALRVGISGTPGVGKSTFVEALGNLLIDRGHRVAVLAVDPSSERSHGSILGDKTRMERLAARPEAFIRPSPTAGQLGGLARASRETAELCAAAGYEYILVETVGVGQSETAVAQLVDCFVLLLQPGAGDELQGIKRGIVEMADLLLINKAEGENRPAAEQAQREYRNALHLFPPSESGWSPPVELVSAQTGAGIEESWALVEEFQRKALENGYFARKRQDQARYWLDQQLREAIYRRLAQTTAGRDRFEELQSAVLSGQLATRLAVARLLAESETKT